MSRLRGNLFIFGNKNLDVHLEEKEGQKEKKFMNFIFATNLTFTLINTPISSEQIDITFVKK